MPAYNFMESFTADIESGKKHTTIRRKRKKNPTVAGDKLYLYTNQRTKKCRKLGEQFCRALFPISISRQEVMVGTDVLKWHELEALAYTDGFKSVDDFFDFFEIRYGLPILFEDEFELIVW